MQETVTLVLVFLDEDNNEKSIVIKDPKMDLTMEEVQAAMTNVIDNDAILTPASRHLSEISNCYYKTVTITVPEFATEGE